MTAIIAPHICNVCGQKHYYDDPEKTKETRKKYNDSHKEERNLYRREYLTRPGIRDRMLEERRRFYQEHREEINAWMKEYHKEHPEQVEDSRDRTIVVGNKRIAMPKGIYPRTGICSECNASAPFPGKRCKRTFIRHDTLVDPEDPMRYTREVCPSCHARLNFAGRRS